MMIGVSKKKEFHLRGKILHLLGLLSASTQLFASGFNAHVSGGPGWASFNHSEKLYLNSSVENAYTIASNDKSAALVSLGVGYLWQKPFSISPNIDIDIGANASYISYDLAGINSPFINVGRFDTLTFHVTDKSYNVLLEPKIVYTRSDCWQPYVLGGVGIAWNTLSGYNETPTKANSSAAPMPVPFRNQTTSGLSYELGVGVQWFLVKTPTHGYFNLFLDYRYTNWNEMKLATSPAQSTSTVPNLGTLRTQLINLGMEYQFA